MLIRPAILEDIPAMLEIEQKSPEASHWTEEKYREAFEKEIPRRIVLVGVTETAVQGFGVVRVLHQESEIENLVVAYQSRRHGLGTHLLRRLIDLARQEGAVAVNLEVRESNRAARALYSKVGMREFSRRKHYYQTPDEDAILYCL